MLRLLVNKNTYPKPVNLVMFKIKPHFYSSYHQIDTDLIAIAQKFRYNLSTDEGLCRDFSMLRAQKIDLEEYLSTQQLTTVASPG